MPSSPVLVRSRLAATMVATVAVSVLVASSCSSSQADSSVSVLSPQQATALIETGEHTVLDLRSTAAYRAGHVHGAINLPMRAEDFEERLLELSRDSSYLLYSRTGQEADLVAERMTAEGFGAVADAGAFGLLAIAGAPLD